MLTQFASCQIRHVFRETDRDADYIANVGHLVFSSFNVSPCNNYSLTLIIESDTLGTSLEKKVA